MQEERCPHRRRDLASQASSPWRRCAGIGVLTALFFGIRLLVKPGASAGTVLALLYAGLAAASGAAYAGLVRFAERRYREIET